MAAIFKLSSDEIRYLFRFLDIEDRIAFTFSCERFRRFCVDEGIFRKVNLSACAAVKTQQCAISKFFMDNQMAQQITELNISNVHFLNWQIDNELKAFIMSSCPHLEALHVLNCGMSLQTLQRILKKSPKLTALSWSLIDFTSKDSEFLMKSMKTSDGICLKNIRHLHLETFPSKTHMQIVQYLVLSCCKDLEELKLYIWQVDKDYYTALSFHLPAHQINPSASIEDKLQNLHSLTVVALGSVRILSVEQQHFRVEYFNFICSVVRNKSRGTKWRKLWILPPISIGGLFPPVDPSVPLHEIQSDELQSVEEITAYAGWTQNTVDEMKILFQRIGDKTVRSLHLHRPVPQAMFRLCEPILRVGGHVLKNFSLSISGEHEIEAQTNVVLHTLFSNCMNITELDLLDCYFEKDICEPLSELRHLKKVQLMECAISSKYCKESQIETSKANLLTFVENCKKITHLDVRGCWGYEKQFYCCLTHDDLLAFAKLSNLESLTLYSIRGIREWTFFENISENCKFLTMLRISDTCFNNSHLLILMQSAKFLKHLAIDLRELDWQSEGFWNLLSCAKNLERLCIRRSFYHKGWINVPVAVEALKSLPRLRVLHLHPFYEENIEFFYDQTIRMLEEEESDRSSSFELVAGNRRNKAKKALPLNNVELCNMTPILEIPRF